jgi:hypothetical protein
MGMQDKVTHYGLRFIQANALNDEALYKEVWNELKASDVDPIHVVDSLAGQLARYYTQNPGWEQILSDNITTTRLTMSLDYDEIE